VDVGITCGVDVGIVCGVDVGVVCCVGNQDWRSTVVGLARAGRMGRYDKCK
jgi:hypothetical protein